MARAGPAGKKPSGPARITYDPHTGILSIPRARWELKQLCCYRKPDFGQNEQHSEFCSPKKKKKEKRGGHINKVHKALGHGARTSLRSVRTP